MTVPTDFVTWIRSSDDFEHAVTDEDATQAAHPCNGGHALCGHAVQPVSLTSPPGARCPRCQNYVIARATLADLDLGPKHPHPHRHRSRGLLRRRRFKLPARLVPRPGRAGV